MGKMYRGQEQWIPVATFIETILYTKEAEIEG